MTIKSFSQYCVFVLAVALISSVQAEKRSSKPIPKWKLEHMAKIANAEQVCESPKVDSKVDPNNLTTGFYSINLMPDETNQFLNVIDGRTVLIKQEQEERQWLLSEVGTGLYKISSCADQKPVCLTTSADKEITLAACNSFGYGDQAWWLKRYAVGPNKGGWFLGNDGVGQMECLTAGTSLTLETCNNEQHGWRFNRTDQVDAKAQKKRLNN